MKKIFLAFTLIIGVSLCGFSQKNEKILKSSKWYATGDLYSQSIILSKTAPVKSDWDATFEKKGVLNFCSNVKSALIGADGNEVKAGTYYCDPLYTYEFKGDVLYVKYPLVDLYFQVKKLSNGDMQLTATDASAAAGGNSSK